MSADPHLLTTAVVLPKRAPWLGLSVLLLAGFVTIFDLFVVNVAIPSMQADLGASFAQIGFIVAGYELAFGVLLITGGRLGDLFGRRRLFVIGMAGFTLASALCGLAPSAGFLIGARVLQGLAAALLFPQVYASIRVNFDGNDSRRAFGLLIAQVQAAGAGLEPTRLIPVLIVIGAGQGFIMTPLLNLVLGFVEKAQAGMASGVISTVQQVGAALGVAVVGILFSMALVAGDGAVAQAGQYVSAFVAGMLYNLGAALLVCVLLLILGRTQRAAGEVGGA